MLGDGEVASVYTQGGMEAYTTPTRPLHLPYSFGLPNLKTTPPGTRPTSIFSCQAPKVLPSMHPSLDMGRNS